MTIVTFYASDESKQPSKDVIKADSGAEENSKITPDIVDAQEEQLVPAKSNRVILSLFGNHTNNIPIPKKKSSTTTTLITLDNNTT